MGGDRLRRALCPRHAIGHVSGCGASAAAWRAQPGADGARAAAVGHVARGVVRLHRQRLFVDFRFGLCPGESGPVSENAVVVRQRVELFDSDVMCWPCSARPKRAERARASSAVGIPSGSTPATGRPRLLSSSSRLRTPVFAGTTKGKSTSHWVLSALSSAE